MTNHNRVCSAHKLMAQAQTRNASTNWWRKHHHHDAYKQATSALHFFQELNKNKIHCSLQYNECTFSEVQTCTFEFFIFAVKN